MGACFYRGSMLPQLGGGSKPALRASATAELTASSTGRHAGQHLPFRAETCLYTLIWNAFCIIMARARLWAITEYNLLIQLYSYPRIATNV